MVVSIGRLYVSFMSVGRRMVVRVTTDIRGDMVRLVTMGCDPGEPGVMPVTHSSDHSDELD